MEMFEALNLTTIEFDERAIELLATFTPDQGKFIINELLVCYTKVMHDMMYLLLLCNDEVTSYPITGLDAQLLDIKLLYITIFIF